MFLGLGTMHGKAMELLGGMPHEQEGTICWNMVKTRYISISYCSFHFRVLPLFQ